MTDAKLVFNGIDGATGRYLFPSLAPQDVSKLAQDEKLDSQHQNELKNWHRRVTQATLGPKEGVDPKKLSEAGWGIIFAFDDADKTPGILEALNPLLALRKKQAGPLYREYSGQKRVQARRNQGGLLGASRD